MTTLLWSRGDARTDWGAFELPGGESSALHRLWRGFMTARCFVGMVLLVLQLVSFVLGQVPSSAAIALSTAYLALALLAMRFAPFHPPIAGLGVTWISTLGVDLATFATLQTLQVGSINYTPLFALPVLMGAVLGTLAVGLGTTAVATLLLLADAAWHWIDQPAESSARFVQAALTGTGLFLVALLAHQLARRLTREEAIAQHNRGTAQMHAQVNDLVIETLSEGVLVIDDEGWVHAANPAADAILGQGLAGKALPFALSVHPAWQPLASMAELTFIRNGPQTGEIALAQTRGAAREVRVRTRLTPATYPAVDSLCVMFLQDLRELEARIRTEKLAAMGRMSAAVAHEIRNPLAAITQASALLSEDLLDPSQRRRIAMVEQNAQRLARIVDDVLDVARSDGARDLRGVGATDAGPWRAPRPGRTRPGRPLRCRAPAPHPGQPARQRGTLRRSSRRLHPGVDTRRLARPGRPAGLERWRATGAGRAAPSVRAFLLVREPVERTRALPVARTVRAPWRHHRLRTAPDIGKQRGGQRVLHRVRARDPAQGATDTIEA